MSRSPRLTLGGHLVRRRTQLGLSQRRAAPIIGVARGTLRAWEKGAPPEVFNYARIEAFCEWEPGSVAAVLEGRAPTPLRQATVTPLHPGIANAPPPDGDLAELVGEWRGMGLSEETVSVMTALYLSDKADDDTARRQRYLDIAREAGG